MSRSYNSRKGYYNRRIYRWDYLQYEDYRRGKQNRKKDTLKFDGVIFTYKTSKKCIKRKYTRYSWWCDLDEFMNKEIVESKESYQNWSWLKGKANEKGWHPSRFNVYHNDKFGKEYYPCQ